jgi:hypothetical protein
MPLLIRSLPQSLLRLLPVFMLLPMVGCATIRVTDPGRTATEQFLMSQALSDSIQSLSITPLRDRPVFIDVSFLSGHTTQESSFLVAELRSKMLLDGVRLVEHRTDAQVIVEVRSGGIGIDRLEFLLGIPAIVIPGATADGVPVATPELAIIKETRQYGFASVSLVAYWRDSGEIVSSSGPYVGRTSREDFWFFGIGPRTIGNIPTTVRQR